MSLRSLVTAVRCRPRLTGEVIMDVGLLISHRNDGATKVIMVEWRCLSAKSQKAIITITTAKVRGVANAGLTHGRGHSMEMVNRAK